MSDKTFAVVFWLAIVCGIVYGWINNIVILYHTGMGSITGEIILRVVGIFVAPVGIVMGYL